MLKILLQFADTSTSVADEEFDPFTPSASQKPVGAATKRFGKSS